MKTYEETVEFLSDKLSDRKGVDESGFVTGVMMTVAMIFDMSVVTVATDIAKKAGAEVTFVVMGKEVTGDEVEPQQTVH